MGWIVVLPGQKHKSEQITWLVSDPPAAEAVAAELAERWRAFAESWRPAAPPPPKKRPKRKS